MTEQLLTAAEVADRLGIAVSTVYAYRRDGKLTPTQMVGRTPVWTVGDLDRQRAQWPGRGAGGGRPRKGA